MCDFFKVRHRLTSVPMTASRVGVRIGSHLVNQEVLTEVITLLLSTLASSGDSFHVWPLDTSTVCLAAQQTQVRCIYGHTNLIRNPGGGPLQLPRPSGPILIFFLCCNCSCLNVLVVSEIP